MFRKISNLFITIILFLITIIFFKSNIKFKEWFTKNVLDSHIPFAKISEKYESLFGLPIPLKKSSFTSVFNEKLKYLSKENYDNGVILNLENNLVPSIEKGIVIFVGNKENKKCLTIESAEHDITYCMFTNVGVKLYDHVEIGSYLGETSGKLLLYFTKNGEYLNYEEFI